MFDKLKSIFIVEEEGDSKSKVKTESKSSAANQKTSTPKASTTRPVVVPSTGKVSAKFTEVLFKAMEANNIDGFDYLEFKHSLKSLEKMPMDEETRFKSAFAMAQTMGATPDYLVKTANHYIRILLQEDEKFGQALANQRSRQIGDKENQIKQLDNIIKEKLKRIDSLKVEIEKHSKDMQSMKSEISSAAIKVENTKNDFQASFTNLVNQIKKDMESMKKFLK